MHPSINPPALGMISVGMKQALWDLCSIMGMRPYIRRYLGWEKDRPGYHPLILSNKMRSLFAILIGMVVIPLLFEPETAAQIIMGMFLITVIEAIINAYRK